MTSVRIDPYVRDDPEPSMAVMTRGGIAVRIDGERLNRYSREDDLSWIHDWNPEYAGEHVLMDTIDLVEYAVALRTGEMGVYDSVRLELAESPSVFVFERLSDDDLRIAFQTRATDEEHRQHLPPTDVARGSVVSIDEFCAEVLDCAQEVVAAGERFGVADVGSFETLREERDELRSIERGD